jgi:hypothetical protein
MRTIFDNTAVLTNTRNEQSVEAEVDNVRDHESLDAFVAHTKIHMKWNCVQTPTKRRAKRAWQLSLCAVQCIWI